MASQRRKHGIAPYRESDQSGLVAAPAMAAPIPVRPRRESQCGAGPAKTESDQKPMESLGLSGMKYDRNAVKAWAGDSQWRALQADLARFRMSGYSGWGSEGFWALALFRLQKVVHNCRPKWLWMPIIVLLAVIRKLLVLAISVDLHPSAEIGPGLLIAHGAQILVIEGTRIGADCALNHVCTIGAGSKLGGANIGDHVYIACHSCILGPATIGDGALISPGSLVIEDVPAGATAIGVPARILPSVRRAF
jgi:serine O-acetyltransferase